MSKNKTLSTRTASEAMLHDPLDPTHAGNCHHYAKLHLAVGAAYAVLCGAELLRIQAALKKTATRCSFEDWMTENRENLGFNARMGFHYKKIAEHVKSKLLVSRDADVMALLDRSPASLQPGEQKTLLAAVNKAVDGQSIRELLEELSIARREGGAGLLGSRGGKGGAKTAGDEEPTPELLIQDDLFSPIDKLLVDWFQPYKVGKTKVPLWQHIPKPKLRQYVQKLEAIVSEAKEALAK